MALLTLQGLAKRFGAVRAVEDFDLAVGDGEFVALLGPSGCGKTTVMRMIAGITAPDQGSIAVNGRTIDALPPEKRNVGLVFQSYALFPHMDVAANIAFGLKMRGVSARERATRIEAALSLVSLEGYGHRFPRELSGGQQQRVAVARAVVIAPDVLLLDEPLSNLDAKLREGLREELRALQKRLGITALYVTHDQDEALALADRIVVMNEGRIVEAGSPVELYRQPRRRFTAAFLGHSNLIEVSGEAGGLRLPWGEIVPMAGSAGQGPLCIRPEDVAPIADPAGPGRIEAVTFLGGETVLTVSIGGQIIRVSRAGQHGAAFNIGDKVRLVLPRRPHRLEAEA